MSGYTDCGCRDCFDVAIADSCDDVALCHACEAAGCTDGECEREDAYGAEDSGPDLLAELPYTTSAEPRESWGL